MNKYRILPHRHKWSYGGRWNNVIKLRCKICDKRKRITIDTEGDYSPDKIDRIIKQMQNSTKHLNKEEE